MGCLVCTKPPDAGGVQVYDGCEISDGQLCLPCRQYMEVEAQVLALKESLAAASMRQIELRTEMNIQHDSITHRLPSEILSTIFESYIDIDTWASRPFLDDEGGVAVRHSMFTANTFTSRGAINWCSPWALGAVCHTWRRIAWSSPQLWTKIGIRLTYPKDWNLIEVAQECLSRSGALDLSIRMVCGLSTAGRQKLDEKELVRLISMINQHSSRWMDLHPYCRRELSPLIFGDLDGASILHTLSQKPHHFNSQPSHDVDFGIRIAGATSYRPHVPITKGSIMSLDFDWSRVTKIQFSTSTWVYLDNCIELLRYSPHLVDLQTPYLGDVDRYQFPSPDSPIPLKLQNLLIGNYKGNKLGVFLGVFVFPHLTHLTLGDVDKSALGHFANMIKRSSCRIISVRLYYISYTLETLLELVREIPFLRELKISYCITDFERQVVGFYRHLANASISDTADSSREPILPNLQYIHYHHRENYAEYTVWHPLVWSLLPNMLGTLHKIIFTTDIGYKHKLELICKDKTVLMCLVELLDSGIKLTLKHDGYDLLAISMRHCTV